MKQINHNSQEESEMPLQEMKIGDINNRKTHGVSKSNAGNEGSMKNLGF
jgi:hypothetical protein